VREAVDAVGKKAPRASRIRFAEQALVATPDEEVPTRIRPGSRIHARRRRPPRQLKGSPRDGLREQRFLEGAVGTGQVEPDQAPNPTKDVVPIRVEVEVPTAVAEEDGSVDVVEIATQLRQPALIEAANDLAQRWRSGRRRESRVAS
jgi:hypothetical protein